ncbi:MAG: T9SS type A sorting domain-containing protein [Saprospiraceae bacterium]
MKLDFLFKSWLPTAIFTVFLSGHLFAQNAIVGTGFSTGWGGPSCPTGNVNFEFFSASIGSSFGRTENANGTGNQYFRLGVDWSGTTGQHTISPGSDTEVFPNTEYQLNASCTTSGAMFTNVSSTSHNYVFKTKDAGASPEFRLIFFNVEGAVSSISSVSQDVSMVYAEQSVVVTAVLDNTFPTGQAAYLRYTKDNYATSDIVEMNCTGTNCTATIPGNFNSPSANVSYYCFTSGNGVAANISNDEADWYSINLNNNGGSNYFYSVSPNYGNLANGVNGCDGSWNDPNCWLNNAVPLSGQAVAILEDIVLDQDATVSSITIGTGKTFTSESGNARTISVSSGGSFNNDGTFSPNDGTVAFLGSGTITGTVSFNNVSTAGGLDFGSSSTVDGIFTINANGFVDTNAPTYGSSATLEYSTGGTYDQSAEWPSSNGPNNVTISGGSSLNLQENKSLSGILNLDIGTCNLGSHTLTIETTGDITGSFNSNNMIIANSSGVLTRKGVGAASTLFPIGTSSSYNPAVISNSGTIDDFSVRIETSVTSPSDPNKVVNRQWQISEATIGGSNLSLTLLWNGAEQAPGFSPGGPVVIGHFNGSGWEETLSSVSGPDPYTVNGSGFTSLSPFAIGNQSSLPVELIDFSISKSLSTTQLLWLTISETNNSHFDIQRSPDSKTWVDIGKVKGHGNSLERNSYKFMDEYPLNGINYYRLKQFDFDGQFEYSKVVSIDFEKENKAVIYPNPVDGNLFIGNIKNMEEGLDVLIYDTQNRLVKNDFIQLENDIAVGDLLPGIYFIKIKDQTGFDVLNERFVKK